MFISGSSKIRKQAIYHQGTLAFENTSVPLDDFLTGAYDHFSPEYPKFYKMDRLAKLGFLATEVLLRDLPIKQYAPEAVSLVLSNAHASLDTDVRYHEAAKTSSSPALFVYTLPNIVSGEICIRHKIKGENTFFVSPSFDAGLHEAYVNQVMQQPSVRACIAGWIDVMDSHHDVFLYLIEKEKRGLALPHTAEELTKLYR
jgi:3-oxoacyl-(acyl-carrier-protein) synthase